MILHNDKKAFEEIVIRTSNHFGIDVSIIEKDYYVTIMLKELVKNVDNLVFKGGTSLSKCFKLIKRFSEDIDLNIDTSKHPTDSERKRFSSSIEKSIESLNFKLLNPEEIRSRRDFNQYKVDYHTLFKSESLNQSLIIETAVFIRSFPCVEKNVSSYLYDYMKNGGYNNLLRDCNLEPFTIKVQSLERTFIDKLFAIADYYLCNDKSLHSRHIYDLHILRNNVKFDTEFFKLLREVKNVRSVHKNCPSSKEGVILSEILRKIVQDDYFKTDYDEITTKLLFENVSYNAVINSLLSIIKILFENSF